MPQCLQEVWKEAEPFRIKALKKTNVFISAADWRPLQATLMFIWLGQMGGWCCCGPGRGLQPVCAGRSERLPLDVSGAPHVTSDGFTSCFMASNF